MRAVFRVDASRAIGSGHFMRCLALADALSRRGVEPWFVSREHPGHLLHVLHKRAMRVAVLPAAADGSASSTEEYASWLGASVEVDAAQTIAAFDGSVPDWLIVDHYAIESRWERLLRPHAGRLMAIDDLANRAHDCDLLLDQNFSATGNARYRGLVPDACTLLTGPRYALLAPEYSRFRRMQGPRNAQVRRVFVFFGGTDPNDMTGATLEALSAPELRHLQADIVVGASYPHRDRLERQARDRPGTAVHSPLRHLANLMAEADLAIGAGGTTTWERMCLGLPSVVISIADNQRPTCLALAEAGRIRYAGHWDEIDAASLARLVHSLTESAQALCRIGIDNQLLVDGFGALRAVEALCPSEWARVRERAATEDDAALHYEWSHASQATAAGRPPQPETWSDCAARYAGELQREDTLRLVLEAEGLPLGGLTIRRADDDALADFRLDPIIRGRKWEARVAGAAAGVVRRCRMARAGGPVSLPYLRRESARPEASPSSVSPYSIQILSDASSWINESIPELLAGWLDAGHRVLWVHDREDLRAGDFCFLLGCSQIIPHEARTRLRHCLVVHESDLPQGKGWSPLTWQILEGSDRIPVTLIEAADKVDSGMVYAQEWLQFAGHELADELRAAVAQATLGLCRRFVVEYPRSARNGRAQVGAESFYPRRSAQDSRIDTAATIEAQFNLLRVVDNARYPAYFERHGFRYELRVRKAGAS